MGDDVVEGAGVFEQDAQVLLTDLDVGQRQVCHRLAERGRLDPGRLDGHEARGRQGAGHGEEVAAAGRADLEDTTVLDSCRAEAAQMRQQPQAVGMRLPVGEAGIGNLVVRRGHARV